MSSREKRKYPVGSISYDLLMQAAHLLHPGPFVLYVALLVRCAGKTECNPSRKTLAADLNTQPGAIKRGLEQLKEAKLLEIRQGEDGLEHYIVSLPGVEQRRAERNRDWQRTQEINDQRAKERAELLRSREAGRQRGKQPGVGTSEGT